MRKPKAIFLKMNSCSGCLLSIINSQVFPDFLQSFEVQYFPMLTDHNKIDAVDYTFVEGAISNKDEETLLKNVRSKSNKLIAIGSCACYGGVMSLSQKIKVQKISSVVETDIVLPGCPPHPTLIGTLLLSIISGKEYTLQNKNLCIECPLKPTTLKPKSEIKLSFPQQKVTSCFLNEGILCLGPITRMGCNAICIQNGLPCDGCMGSFNRQLPSAMINLLSLYKIESSLQGYKGILYRYQKAVIG